jgi:hypothetical protein
VTKTQFIVECKPQGRPGQFCEVTVNSRFENFSMAEERASHIPDSIEWRINQVTTTNKVVARKEKSK